MPSDEDLLKIIETQNKLLGDVASQIEMSQSLFYQVVERTQNFREGFYSIRKINDLSSTIAKQMQIDLQAVNNPQEMVHAIQDILQNLSNLQATILTETNRIDS